VPEAGRVCYGWVVRACVVVLVVVCGLGSAVFADEGSGLGPAAEKPTPSEPSPGAASPRIDTAAGPATDDAIARRLRGIFDELEGLREVRISVRGGVVELSGEVLSTDLRQRAVRLAGQVQGVVEVEDHLREVRDVQRRIAPVLERLTDRGWDLVAWLPLLAVAALIVGIFWLLGWGVGHWKAPFRHLARNRFLADLIQQVVRGAIVVAGLVIALDVLDARALVGTVLGAAGILGLALGFALRDTVENYIASLLLSLRQPFAHDDLVLIEGWEGRVLRLTSRATVLMTLDGNHVRIPNAIVYKSIIVNYTRNPSRRFHFDVGIGVEQDLAPAQRLGAETLARMDGVAEDPPPVATVETLGDSTVVIRLTGWVDQRRAEFLKVRSEAIRLVKQAFDAGGVSMPEPLYRVRLSESVPGTRSDAGEPEAHAAPRLAPRGPTVAVDISPQDHLDRQISTERSGHAEDDLLTPDAPRE
jgi:small conductance mechanosensitive channel